MGDAIELSLVGGETVELTVRDGRLEVEPLPAPHRAPGRLVQEFLDVQFPDAHLSLPAREQRRLPGRFVKLGLAGGAVYDALVALTAAHAGASLVGCDQRALAVYQRCGIETRMLG